MSKEKIKAWWQRNAIFVGAVIWMLFLMFSPILFKALGIL